MAVKPYSVDDKIRDGYTKRQRQSLTQQRCVEIVNLLGVNTKASPIHFGWRIGIAIDLGNIKTAFMVDRLTTNEEILHILGNINHV